MDGWQRESTAEPGAEASQVWALQLQQVPCYDMTCRGSLASRMLQCFPLHIQGPCESLCKDLWRAHSEPETRLPPKVLCRQQMLKIVISSEVSDSRSGSARKRQRPGLQGLKRGPSLAAKWVLRTIGSH